MMELLIFCTLLLASIAITYADNAKGGAGRLMGGPGFFSSDCWRNGEEPVSLLNANFEVSVIPSSSNSHPHQPLANMDGGLATYTIELFANGSPLTGFVLIDTWNLENSKVDGNVWSFKEKDMQPRPGGTFKFADSGSVPLRCGKDRRLDEYLSFKVTAKDSSGQPIAVSVMFPGTVI